MDLNTLWFILIAVLYTGFFVLEGFDFGVGMLIPFLSKDDTERRVMLNTIGPHWDGNEVWLLTAGGATFAAFPHWYATLFSGFYLPLFLLLVALIVRGVAFEFRSKDTNRKWRTLWDWCIFVGSVAPAFLIGVAFANILRGVPIDGNMQFRGDLFDLLNPYALVGGLAAALTFLLHGGIFLSMKTTGALFEKSINFVRQMWILVVIELLALLVGTYRATDFLSHRGLLAWIVPILGIAAILAAGYFIRQGKEGWAFVMTSLTIVIALVSFFMALYPRVMVSSWGAIYDLTVKNAASSPYTLKVMTIVAVIFVPIVLIYQAWSYRVFRKRIESKPETLTY
jgi:cytochrome d ubiquinol oxidase subunit II